MPPEEDMLQVEQCQQCETLWPAGSLEKVCKVMEPSPIEICPDCIEEIKRRERKIVRNRQPKKIKKSGQIDSQ